MNRKVVIPDFLVALVVPLRVECSRAIAGHRFHRNAPRFGRSAGSRLHLDAVPGAQEGGLR